MTEVADLIEEAGFQLSVEVEDRTRQELLKAYGRGADMLAYETSGKTGPVSLGGTVPRQVLDHIDEIVAPIGEWNEGLAETVGDLVREKAVREDLSPAEVAGFIRDELPRVLGSEKITIHREGKRPYTTTPDQYTEMIARTLPATLRNEAYLDEAEKAGIYASWTWVALGDERMCDICGQRHGKTYGFDAPRPPGHPNCLHPSTRIVAPGGIVAATRSKYSGPVMELTFESGRRLTVTPNHLFLTPDGFASAKLLTEGDDVQSCPLFEGMGTVNPDDDRHIATIEEIFDTLRVTGGGPARSVPVTPEDFHGDAKLFDENIDVVGADRLLGNAFEPAGFEHGSERDLRPGDASLESEVGPGYFASVLQRLATATDGLVGGRRQTSPFFTRRFAHSEIHGLAPVERDDPPLPEPACDCVSRHQKMISECRDRLASRMKPDKLVKIEVYSYHGFVYDVESLSTLLIGNGIYLSNCRCRALLNLAEDAEKPDGAPAPEQIAQVRARQDALDESYALAVALTEERARLIGGAGGKPLKGADAKQLSQLESAITKQRREAAKIQTEIYRIKAYSLPAVPAARVESDVRRKLADRPVILDGLDPDQATNAGAVVSAYERDYPGFTQDYFCGIATTSSIRSGKFDQELDAEIKSIREKAGPRSDPQTDPAAEIKSGLNPFGGATGWLVRSVVVGGLTVMLANDEALSSPDLGSTLATDVRDGKLPWGSESPIALWETEFGRLASTKLGLVGPGSELDRLFESAGPTRIRTELGEVAAVSSESFAAAAWSEYRTSPNSRPLARTVGNYLEHHLQLYEAGHRDRDRPSPLAALVDLGAPVTPNPAIHPSVPTPQTRPSDSVQPDRSRFARIKLTETEDFPDPPAVRARLDRWNRRFIRRRYSEDGVALREEYDRLAADVEKLHPDDRAGWPPLRGLKRWREKSSPTE